MTHDRLDTEELRPGMQLGPYELVLEVGAGGMARVWVARSKKTKQLVALKILLSHLAENGQFRQMFFDEARIASRVKHPNVCATYELADEGVLMLVMEWIDGASLDRILRPGPESEDEGPPRIPLPYRHAAKIVADACAGLHAAHELRGDDGHSLDVVHRDVSPHNLLLTADGNVKVTDFGVAKALGKSHMTLAGQVKGKLAYMSPEHLMGSGVDRRSDVFALGCVLYEITTGQRPFQGEHDPQVMAAIVMGNYQPPSELVPGYPRDLEAILVRAMGGEPGERFPTAENMRRALEGYLAASGPPLGTPQIAALLHERCGPSILARAQALGTNVAPPSRAKQPSHHGTEEAPRAERPRNIGLMIVAALVGALLGLGVLVYVRAAVKKSRATTTVVTPPATSSTTSAAPPVEDASSANDITEIDDAIIDASSFAPVHLKLPTGANLVVDGVTLPSGVDTVARPVDGGTVTVLVRADKFQDTILIVDSTTPSEIEVMLAPVTRPKPKPRLPDENIAPPNPYN